MSGGLFNIHVWQQCSYLEAYRGIHLSHGDLHFLVKQIRLNLMMSSKPANITKNPGVKGDIPDFGLYGESSARQDPGFVHIEDIAARSRAVGWHIKPHRHDNMFQILCVFDGDLDVQIDAENHSLTGGWAITIPPGVVHVFRFQPDTKGAVLSLAAPLFAEENYRRSRQYFDELVDSAQMIEFQKQSVLFDQLRHYLNMIAGEFQQAEAGHRLMLEWLVSMVLMTLKRQSDHTQLETSSSPPASRMLKMFRSLLESKYRQQWSVQQYAVALHTSVSSLNRVCNKSVGITAKSMIKNRVLIEAKRKLIYTQYPVDQVAYTLGFKDPAYFARYFKKLEGVPPSVYRTSVLSSL